MTIACLHTAERNIAAFEEAAERMGLSAGTLRHTVRPDLLQAAELAGGMTAEIEAETRSVLLMLGQEADGVLLTCSTLGPSADFSASANATPTLRADGALAQRAVAAATAAGGSVVVLCAAESTIVPTTNLFREAARQTGTKVEVILVAGAWDLFKAGEVTTYLKAIAAASDEAYASGASVVALAQASMTDAGRFVKGPHKPLASPAAGLQAIVERLSRG
jgi:hypothetical protein